VGSFSGLKIACDGKWPVRRGMFLAGEKAGKWLGGIGLQLFFRSSRVL